jgi:quercetin dioxygenase-like cupin family protein
VTTLPRQSGGSQAIRMLALPVILGLITIVVTLTPLKSMFSQPAKSGATTTAPTGGRVASVYTNAIEGKVLYQKALDRVPEGALLLRLTELEMEPEARIFEHRQLGPGVHLVHRGSLTYTDSASQQSETYQSGQVYYEGMDPLHSVANNGQSANRVLMADLVPRERGFDGNQSFTDRGKHNEGEVRSGPYVQYQLNNVPEGPLMMRVTEIAFGPKTKTVEHTRMGPVLFRVEQGGLTIRKEASLHMMTYGTNGYFFDNGTEPLILENKPASPMKVLMFEVLPASVGDGQSTRITGS